MKLKTLLPKVIRSRLKWHQKVLKRMMKHLIRKNKTQIVPIVDHRGSKDHKTESLTSNS